MRTPEWLRSYLSFSRKDRLGLILVFSLILISYLLPKLFSKPDLPFPLDAKTLALMEDSLDVQASVAKTPVPSVHPFTNFSFDPNTLDSTGWLRLGLTPKTIRTLLKYRSKGGTFRKPEDLSKIWGLPSGFFERVLPYISIPRPSASVTSHIDTTAHDRRPVVKRTWHIDINSSDSSAWESLPGIGSRLAARILVFRRKLGGFYTIDQIGETYGLADSVFRMIRPYLFLEKGFDLIRINAATEEELRSHPYIRWKLAKAIVAYRMEHGHFNNARDLEKIVAFGEGQLAKLLPYISFEMP